MINSEDSVFINLFENIVEKKPINSNIVSKLNRKLNVNTQKNSIFDPRDFYKLVKNYLDKIHRKMNKYGIEPYDYIVNFTNDIFEIINDTLPSKTKDQKPSKSVNNKENRMGKIMNLNQFEYQGAIDCLKKFENIAEKLVNIYFEFVNREFKALFTSQYEIYEKIINPDICSSVINTIDSARFKHSIHFIVKLFYDVLKSQKEKQPSYVIYDAFKERLVKNFGDIKDQTHFVNMYFYYCQQLFAHIGIISVSSQRPFYLEVMRN